MAGSLAIPRVKRVPLLNQLTASRHTSTICHCEKQTQRIGSGVVVGGNVFIVNAGPGTAQCMECQTGKIRWSERLEGGEAWGSVVMAAGRLYVTSRAASLPSFGQTRRNLSFWP